MSEQDRSVDTLEQYLQEIRSYPLLTPEQEHQLALGCAAGDPEARRALAASNLRLVVSVAREYAGRGLPLLDLIQEGSIGLLAAVQKFDPSLPYRFSTYATKWIRQAITRCLMNHAGLIRVPGHTAQQMRRLLNARSAFRQAQDREPTLEELSQAADLTPDKAAKLLQLIPETCSLDASADAALEQLLPRRADTDPQEVLIQAQLLELTDRLLAMLPPRQQTILRLRFGMDDGICHSLEDIAGLLHLSKERVRQVEKQAFDKLKALGPDLGMEDFLED